MQYRRSFLKTVGATLGAFAVASGPATAVSTVDDDAYTETPTITIDSFDGTTLEASLFEPTETGPHPAILMTHGWGGTRADRADLARFYASNGYVVLTYDSRGFGDSDGQVTVNGPAEVGDAKRLITWLANHDAVQTDGPDDPRIGMDGYSYGAGIQLNTAAEDDRLDALVPRWGWWNLSYSNAPNDVLKWAWFYALYISGRRNGNLDSEFDRLSRRAIEERDAPPALHEFWRSRSPVEDIEQVDTPALFISGWEDRLFPANEPVANFEALRRVDTETRLLLYDYGHDFVGWGSPTNTQLQTAQRSALKWLDKYLKGADESVPAVNIYSRQEDAFTSYETLPAKRGTRKVELHETVASRTTKLSTASGAGTPTSVRIDLQIDDAVEVVGVPTLSVHVTPTGKTSHLFAALEDVGPDGETTVLKDQVAATKVTESGRIEFDLHGVQRRIPAGHDLKLRLAVDDDALTRRKAVPFDDGLYVDSDTPAGVVLHHTTGKPATLTLPTGGSATDDT